MAIEADDGRSDAGATAAGDPEFAYWRQREAIQRQAARVASAPYIARIHSALADLHAGLVGDGS